MKNKEVCLKCVKNIIKQNPGLRYSAYLSKEFFHRRWQTGNVHCFHSGININGAVSSNQSTKIPAPDSCPYLLEHTVNEK